MALRKYANWSSDIFLIWSMYLISYHSLLPARFLLCDNDCLQAVPTCKGLSYRDTLSSIYRGYFPNRHPQSILHLWSYTLDLCGFSNGYIRSLLMSAKQLCIPFLFRCSTSRPILCLLFYSSLSSFHVCADLIIKPFKKLNIPSTSGSHRAHCPLTLSGGPSSPVSTRARLRDQESRADADGGRGARGGGITVGGDGAEIRR